MLHLSAVLIFLLLPTQVKSGNPFPNTTDGIHLFGLWDHMEMNAIHNPAGGNVSMLDYFWSVEEANLPKIRSATPKAVLSAYIPFGLNSMPASIGSNLTWWQEHHPSWVLYRCDRKTPATYWGAGIPLDLSNPEVLDWQMSSSENPRSVDKLIKLGYDAISLDVFAWANLGHACGVYDKSGKWKQLYSGSNKTDPAFESTARSWMREFYRRLARRIWFIINYSSAPSGCQVGCPSCLPSCDAWNSTKALFVGNHSDGTLSEAGFTSFGSNISTDLEWENRLLHMLNQQRNGKFFLDLSYWGPLNVVTKQPVDPDFTAPVDYLIGSWMLGNEGLSAVYMGPNDCYKTPCVFDGWKGNMLNYTQFLATVGVPLNSATKGVVKGQPADLCAHVWTREYSAALVWVNPQPVSHEPPVEHKCKVSLETGWEYTRLDGRPFGGDSVTLPPASALVLQRTRRVAELMV